MHFFAERLQAGPLARTYMLGYEQMMRKKSIKSRKYRGHSPSKSQNILIFHQNPLQHPISSLSASHVIIYCVYGLILSLPSTKRCIVKLPPVCNFSIQAKLRLVPVPNDKVFLLNKTDSNL